MLSELLDAPALQIHRQLEEGDSLWAADRPRAGHHPTGRLELLQELRKHCRGGERGGSSVSGAQSASENTAVCDVSVQEMTSVAADN